jgi:hypothetical protein
MNARQRAALEAYLEGVLDGNDGAAHADPEVAARQLVDEMILHLRDRRTLELAITGLLERRDPPRTTDGATLERARRPICRRCSDVLRLPYGVASAIVRPCVHCGADARGSENT